MGAAFSACLPEPQKIIPVVVASPIEDDHSALRAIFFGHSNWRLYDACTCREALALVREHNIPVVICERNLPDGDWKALLEQVAGLPAQPRLIVASRLADDQLWAEVLNLGGYDVLVTPFDAREVFRVVFLAWHSSRYDAERTAVARKPAQSAPDTEEGNATAAASAG